MQNNKSKLGFSLIELSVVILIIGILTLGITKGSRIISSAKLSSARSLTNGSPVNLSGNGLSFWLETTSEKSLSSVETVDGGGISIWNDTKLPISNDPVNVVQGTQIKKPLYIKNAINGLPAIRFDGLNDFLSKANVKGNAFTVGNQITIFAVQKYYTPSHQASLLFWNPDISNMITLIPVWSDGVLYFDFGGFVPGVGRTSFSPLASFYNKPNILVGVRRPNGTSDFRVNGTSYNATTATGTVNTSLSAEFFIGSSDGTDRFEKGDIGEIIVFKTSLSNTEISDIEKYLSVKWGVALNGLN